MKKIIIGLFIATACISPVKASSAEFNIELFKGELYQQLQEYSIEAVPKINQVEGYEHKDKSIIGNIDYGKKAILIKSTRRRQEHIFYHEVGHLIWKSYDLEDSAEWEAIYEKADGCDILTEYYLGNSKEYFAEMFAHYMDIKDSIYFNYEEDWYNELMSVNPEAYQFINTIAECTVH